MEIPSDRPAFKSPAAVTTREQEFTVVRLTNETAEIAVMPQLGARLLSLRNLHSGREWLWRPTGPLRLFRNSPGAEFSTGTMVGADECLPTIAACDVAGRKLPDHGEVWTQAWTLDEPALVHGTIRTTIQLPLSPLCFTRTIHARRPTGRPD